MFSFPTINTFFMINLLTWHSGIFLKCLSSIIMALEVADILLHSSITHLTLLKKTRLITYRFSDMWPSRMYYKHHACSPKYWGTPPDFTQPARDRLRKDSKKQGLCLSGLQRKRIQRKVRRTGKQVEGMV